MSYRLYLLRASGKLDSNCVSIYTVADIEKNLVEHYHKVWFRWGHFLIMWANYVKKFKILNWSIEANQYLVGGTWPRSPPFTTSAPAYMCVWTHTDTCSMYKIIKMTPSREKRHECPFHFLRHHCKLMDPHYICLRLLRNYHGLTKRYVN